MTAKQPQPRQPLLDAVVPIWQRQSPGDNFIGQQPRRGFRRRRFDAFGGQRQVPKTQ